MFLTQPYKSMNKMLFNLGMPRYWLPYKLLLIMRMIIVIMTTCLLQVSAAGFGQNITLSERNTPMAQVLKKIKAQSGMNVVFADDALEQAKRVNVKLNNVPLKEAMDKVLENQDLFYELKENTIVIVKKTPSFLEKLADRVGNYFVNIDVSGKVVDENGQPIPGATVKVKDANQTVLTDANGAFKIGSVAEGATIVISVIGYDKKEVPASKNIGTVRLAVTTNPLDEVRVVAYGTTSSRLTVGNSGGIKASEIEKHPVQNVLSALQGRVSGIEIQPTTGVVGSGMQVRTQGINSFSNGSDPLYVIDGIPYISQLSTLGLNGSVLGATQSNVRSGFMNAPGNPLNFLNPGDIESVELLKDASATAIYGSRAANGAIIITTKKGKSGPIKIDMNLLNGWSTVTNRMKLLDNNQYIAMRIEALKNDNLQMTDANAYDIRSLYGWDNNRNTNWQNVLLGGTAGYLNSNVNISGGSGLTNYLFGFDYKRQTTNTPGDFADNKGSLHFNIGSSSPNRRFRAELTGSAMIDNNQLQTADLTAVALKLPPTAPEIYNTDGSLNWAIDPSGTETWENPYAFLEGRYINKTANLITNLSMNYNIISGLDLKLSSGYNYLHSDETVTSPLSLSSPRIRQLRKSTANYVNSTLQSWTIEPQLSYQKQFGTGKIQALVGTSFQQYTSDALRLNGTDYLSDALLRDPKSAASLVAASSANSVYKYTALFGRINYALKDRYILEVSARRDGSSRFGTENRFQNFASVGAAWIFTEEALVKKYVPLLSFGKIKASYGITGNDQIGDYKYYDLYTTNTGSIPYQGGTTIYPYQLFNPYLQWEETRKLNVGVDLGFAEDRFLLSVNYARNRSKNQLLDYALPLVTGFGSIATNLDAAVIQNTSWEFVMNLGLIKEKKFNWSMNTNLTLPKNKLVSYEGLEKSSFANTYVVGEPIMMNKLYNYIGVNPANGKHLFQDKNGNPTLTPQSNADQYIYLNTQRKINMGFTNSFSYNGLKLDVFLQFMTQNKLTYFYYTQSGIPGFVAINQPLSVEDRWRNPGDNNKLLPFVSTQISSLSFLNFSRSTGAYANYNIVRLKNVALSYELPKAWMDKLKLRRVNVFMQGENLAVWSSVKYPGLDPETGSTSMPPLRTVTAGVRLGF